MRRGGGGVGGRRGGGGGRGEDCVIRLYHTSLIKLKKGLGNHHKCQNKAKKC